MCKGSSKLWAGLICIFYTVFKLQAGLHTSHMHTHTIPFFFCCLRANVKTLGCSFSPFFREIHEGVCLKIKARFALIMLLGHKRSWYREVCTYIMYVLSSKGLGNRILFPVSPQYRVPRPSFRNSIYFLE